MFVAVGERLNKQRLGVGKPKVHRKVLSEVGITSADELLQAVVERDLQRLSKRRLVVPHVAGFEIGEPVQRRYAHVGPIEPRGEIDGAADVARHQFWGFAVGSAGVQLC